MATKELNKECSDAYTVTIYIFLARAVNILSFEGFKEHAKRLPEKVFKLEKMIGDINIDIEFEHYRMFLHERQLFYTYFATDVLTYSR